MMSFKAKWMNTVFLVEPAAFHRQAHAVEHEAVQELRVGGKALETVVYNQNFRYAVKAVLLRLVPVMVIKALFL
jgi:hypothetical protein